MNLSDLRQEGFELEKDLQDVRDIMIELQLLINTKENFESNTLEEIFTNELYSGDSDNTRAIRKLNSSRTQYCTKFLFGLRKINFTNSILKLSKVKEDYKNFDFKSFYNEYFNMLDIVHDYIARIDGTNDFKVIEKVCSAIKLVLDLYSTLLYEIREINKIYIKLFGENEENYLTIRLMNENNYVSNLNNNIGLIESIYNSVNELVGNPDKKLTYIRAESGTFAMVLAGFGTVLLTMRPLLELAYKAYSEQISPKAKIELQLRKVELESNKIKLRGEYLKLLKDATESKELNALNIEDEGKILTIISNLDMDIKELYSNNPYIKLNEKDLGLKDSSVDKVPIELIESGDKDIKKLEELIIEN